MPAPFLQQAERFVDRGSRALDISVYGRAIGNLGRKPWVLDRAERDVQLARSLAQRSLGDKWIGPRVNISRGDSGQIAAASTSNRRRYSGQTPAPAQPRTALRPPSARIRSQRSAALAQT